VTTPIPTVQYDTTGEAALDLESFVRDVAHKYNLTTAEQLYALTLVQKTLLRAVVNLERKEAKDE
jgi:hypothetical protein